MMRMVGATGASWLFIGVSGMAGLGAQAPTWLGYWVLALFGAALFGAAVTR